MSAFIAFKHEHCIRILTDGASYDDNGTVVSVSSKVRTSSAMPLAVTGRGNAAFVQAMMDTILDVANGAGSVDRTLAWLTDELDQRRARGLAAAPADMMSDVLICAFSETEGLVQRYFKTYGADAWRLVTPPDQISAGRQLPADLLARLVAETSPTDPLFLRKHGVEIIETMRATHGPISHHESGRPANGYAIGGLCELTTVTAFAATSEILATFNDPIGEKINPFREHTNVQPIGSRKERRAAKAKHRNPRAA